MNAYHRIRIRSTHGFALLLCVALLSPVVLCGCQWMQCLGNHLAYCDPLDEAVADAHARLSAHHAWKQYSHLCAADDPHESHFKSGFVDGYCNVFLGGQGCLPAIPPRRYWKSCYETQHGHLKVMAYFQGYPQGVQAAYELGKSRSTRVPTSTPGYLNETCPTCPHGESAQSEPPSGSGLQGIVPPVPPATEAFHGETQDGPILPLVPIPSASGLPASPFATPP